uniref:Uncharacterized protein n=1 Tax=Arundo donax TaxID=35708 RepID=A0A0A9EAE8_ARUDO
MSPCLLSGLQVPVLSLLVSSSSANQASRRNRTQIRIEEEVCTNCVSRNIS